MKKVLVLIAVCWMSAVSAFSTNPTNASEFQDNHPHHGISFQVFYDNLSPYGDWVSYPGYGYVWVPAVGRDFSPYMTDGQWVYSDEGWLWASDYRWGWAPFHYGSWLYDDYYGWVWVPGYDWAPAWVTWGYYDDYYGWAPIMPGIHYNTYRPSAYYWHFVPARHLCDRYIYRYEVDRHHNHRYVEHVTYINNYRHDRGRDGDRGRDHDRMEYNSGPDFNHVRDHGHFEPKVMRVSDQKEAGTPQMRDGSITAYRPEVDRDNRGDSKPQKVTPREEVRTNNPRTERTEPGVTRDTRPTRENPRDVRSQPRDQKSVDKKQVPASRPPRTLENAPAPKQNAAPQRRNDNMNGGSPNAPKKESAIKQDNRPVRQPQSQPPKQAETRPNKPDQEKRSTPSRRSGGEMSPSSLERHEAQPAHTQSAHEQAERSGQRRH